MMRVTFYIEVFHSTILPVGLERPGNHVIPILWVSGQCLGVWYLFQKHVEFEISTPKLFESTHIYYYSTSLQPPWWYSSMNYLTLVVRHLHKLNVKLLISQACTIWVVCVRHSLFSYFKNKSDNVKIQFWIWFLNVARALKFQSNCKMPL